MKLGRCIWSKQACWICRYNIPPKAYKKHFSINNTILKIYDFVLYLYTANAGHLGRSLEHLDLSNLGHVFIHNTVALVSFLSIFVYSGMWKLHLIVQSSFFVCHYWKMHWRALLLQYNEAKKEQIQREAFTNSRKFLLIHKHLLSSMRWQNQLFLSNFLIKLKCDRALLIVQMSSVLI